MNAIFEKAIVMMTSLASSAAEGYAYKESWSNNFRISEIDKIFHNYKNTTDETFWKEVFALSDEEKLILGFRKATKEDTKMCIPIWIWNMLPDDMYIESAGKTVKELDNDTRFGVVYWKA